jgi:hypothetical protein
MNSVATTFLMLLSLAYHDTSLTLGPANGELLSKRAESGLEIPRGTPHTMWNPSGEPACASWRTRPAGRTAEWFRTIDRLAGAGTGKPPLPAMAAALTRYGDVFQLAIGPRPLWPAVRAALRLLALGARGT